MKVKLKIDKSYNEPEIHILSAEDTAEVRDVYHMVKAAVEEHLTVYDKKESLSIRYGEIIRIFAQSKMVYVTTANGEYKLRERLYEMEEKLKNLPFVRISNSEIVNLKMIERMDTGKTGTIQMYLAGGIVTYVSRRYIPKIKQALGTEKRWR